MFNGHQSASCSIRIVNREPSRHSLNSKTVHRTERNFLRVFRYICSALTNYRDQYPTGFARFSGCSSNNTDPTCLSHPSMSSIKRLFCLKRASFCGDSYQCCSASSPPITVSFRRPEWRSWSISNLQFKNAAAHVIFRANRLSMLERPRNDLNSVALVDFCSPQIASVTVFNISN